MSYVGLILALLSFVGKLFDWFQERKLIAEGEARQIAKAAIEVARKSSYAKQIMAEFNTATDADVDDFLRELEPGKPGDDGGQLLSDVPKDNNGPR